MLSSRASLGALSTQRIWAACNSRCMSSHHQARSNYTGNPVWHGQSRSAITVCSLSRRTFCLEESRCACVARAHQHQTDQRVQAHSLSHCHARKGGSTPVSWLLARRRVCKRFMLPHALGIVPGAAKRAVTLPCLVSLTHCARRSTLKLMTMIKSTLPWSRQTRDTAHFLVTDIPKHAG